MPGHHLRRLTAAGALALLVTPVLSCGAGPVSPLPVQTAAPDPTATPTPAAAPRETTPPAEVPRRRDRPPAGRPPTPAPSSARPESCLGAIRYDLDLATTELAQVRSMCFRAGAVLRLQGTGPGLVTAEPESLVTQNYAAGVEDIRFVRPGTVTVTIPREEETYTITVVVIA